MHTDMIEVERTKQEQEIGSVPWARALRVALTARCLREAVARVEARTRGRTFGGESAEDLVQQAVMATLAGAGGWVPGAPLADHLATLAEGRIRSLTRRALRVVALPADDGGGSDDGDGGAPIGAGASGGDDVDPALAVTPRMIERLDAARALRRVGMELAGSGDLAAARAVTALCQGIPANDAELARALGVTESDAVAVRRRLAYRARRVVAPPNKAAA